MRIDWPAGFGEFAITVSPPLVTAPAITPCAVYSYEQFALVLIPGLRYRALSAFARAVPKLDRAQLAKALVKGMAVVP